MNTQRHLRFATIASVITFLVLAGLALFTGTTSSIAARGNTGKALAFQAILAANKKQLLDTSPFVPVGRERNTSDGRFILNRAYLHPNAIPAVPSVQGPVQTFDTFAPPSGFIPTGGQPLVTMNLTPAWSSDESFVLFSSNRTASGSVALDGRFHIWAISSNGGLAVQVTTSNARSTDNPNIPHGEFFPALNPSNSQIAFTSDARFSNVQSLYVINFQPGQPLVDVNTLTTPVNSKTLRTDLALDFDNVRRPTWGGSGQIAFSARTIVGPYAGHYHIYYLYASTLGYNQSPSTNNAPGKLTNGPADDNNPAWASDGTYIAFDSTASGLTSTGQPINGRFDNFPLITSAPAASPALHAIFLITSAGTIPSGLNSTNGMLTSPGNDDVTPAWSFNTPNPYSNPRGDTEYVAFARGASAAGKHDIYYIRAVAKALQPGSESGASNQVVEQIAPAGTPLYQIDAGSSAAVAPYAPDDGSTGVTVTGGAPGAFPAGATVVTTGVAPVPPPAAPAAAFLTYHTATPADSSFTYSVPNLAPNATYNIRLQFAEPTATGAGQRVFNVSVNGFFVLNNFDIWAQTGSVNVAVARTIPVQADFNGNVAITFQSVTGNAIVNAIDVFSTGTGLSITQGVSAQGAPQNLTGVSTAVPQRQVTLTWNGVSGAKYYNIYRSSSLAPLAGVVLYQVGVTTPSPFQPGAFTFTDTAVVPVAKYTYFVTAVFPSVTSTSVTREGTVPLHRVNTETDPINRGGYYNAYPAWSPFSRVYSIVYQSNRSITYTNPSNGQASEIEISLPSGTATPAIGSGYIGLLQSQVVNVDPPTLQRFNGDEIVHVNIGSNPVVPTNADETGGATHTVQQGNKVWFTVRISDRTAGVDETGGAGGRPNLYIQIKDPDSKYQDDQGLEHKVFAQDPRSPLTSGGDSGSASRLLFNGIGLNNRVIPPYLSEDGHGFQRLGNPIVTYYQHGVIAGMDGDTPLSIGVNLGPFFSFPPGADPTKPAVFGGDPNTFLSSFGAEYECQYVNPTRLQPSTQIGDYGSPYYLAGFDDRTPFSGNTSGRPRPSSEWLQLNRAAPQLQDNRGGVLYTASWTVPTNTVSDYYLDVIAYNKAVFPFDNNVNTSGFGAGDWRIYDNVWGVTSQGLNTSNDLLVVSDNALGQKLAATSFGGDQSFLSNLLPVFYGAESYVTGVDSAQLANAGYYYVSEPPAVNVFIVPIITTVPFGTYAPNGLNITPMRNSLGANSYIDPVIDDGARTQDGFADVRSQRYSIWRTLCRGQLNSSVLASYGPSLSPSQPAVADVSLGVNEPAAQVPVAQRAVLWFAPFANDLFTGPGSISDSTTQTLLSDFVNGGGRLLVSGQDIVSATPNTSFVSNVLHVSLNDPAGGSWELAPGANNIMGIGNSFISNDFRLDNNFVVDPRWRTEGSLDQLGPKPTAYFSGPDGTLQFLLGKPDAVTPVAGGKSDLSFAGGALSGLTYYENPDPAVGSRVVFASFGLEGISQEVTRRDVAGAPPRNFELVPHINRSTTIHNIVSYLRTGVFTGTVVNVTAGGVSVNGALVYAIPTGGQLGVRKVYSGVTSNGRYTISGVPPGTYTIYASKSGFQRAQSPPTAVEGDVTVSVGMSLSNLPAATIKGIVTDFFTGLPVSGASVEFVSSDNVFTYSAQTGADGVYTIPNIVAYAAGLTYKGVASKLPAFPLTVAQNVTVTPGQTVDGTVANPDANALNANFALKPTPGTVNGRIFNTANSQGIAGASVVFTSNGKTVQTVISGANGVYTSQIGSGTYTVTASKPGFASKAITVIVITNQTTSGNDIGLTPVPPGNVGGLIAGSTSRQPIAGLTVTAKSVDGLITKTFVTTAATTSPASPQGDGQPINYSGTLLAGAYNFTLKDPVLGTQIAINSAPINIASAQFNRVDYAFPAVHAFPAGIQMISAPNDYTGYLLDQLLGADRGKLIIWQPQLLQYVFDPTPPADDLRLGYGYWIKFSHPVDILFAGTPPTTSTVTVPLHTGWNQIGTPSQTAINLSALKFTNPLNPGQPLTFAQATSIQFNLINPNIWGYSQTGNAYFKATSLQPWQGYWIKASSDTSVIIPTNITTGG